MWRRMGTLLLALSLALFSGCATNQVTDDPIDSNKEILEQLHVEFIPKRSYFEYNYDIMLSNLSEKYMTAIVKVKGLNNSGQILGEATCFLNNLPPEYYMEDYYVFDYASDEKEELIVECEIIRGNLYDEPTYSPEINDENIYEYTYLLSDKYEETLYFYLHNLTHQYLNGTISVYLKDEEGNVLEEITKNATNLESYKSVTLHTDNSPLGDYTVEYEVTNYIFRDEYKIILN